MLTIVKLTDRPGKRLEAARWFHEKWGIPMETYLSGMDAALSGDRIQQWYL